MNAEQLLKRLNEVIEHDLPYPGDGATPARHQRLMEVGREDLSLARLAEAHWDAVAILAEANRSVHRDAIYGVWASEVPGKPLEVEIRHGVIRITGSKHFCSGAGLVDRALITAGDGMLIDVDLNKAEASIEYDDSRWVTSAFRHTRTATARFNNVEVPLACIVGEHNWYVTRAGFWHGACGPAACWAGGAEGLLDYALVQRRDDPHTMAHLGAMHASIWAMKAYLEVAGLEIDRDPDDASAAQARALTVRHLIEQECTEVLSRLARAYGPHPLAMDEAISMRYHELELYLRQSHAERDLEALGRVIKAV